MWSARPAFGSYLSGTSATILAEGWGGGRCEAADLGVVLANGGVGHLGVVPLGHAVLVGCCHLSKRSPQSARNLGCKLHWSCWSKMGWSPRRRSRARQRPWWTGVARSGAQGWATRGPARSRMRGSPDAAPPAHLEGFQVMLSHDADRASR